MHKQSWRRAPWLSFGFAFISILSVLAIPDNFLTATCGIPQEVHPIRSFLEELCLKGDEQKLLEPPTRYQWLNWCGASRHVALFRVAIGHGTLYR